MPVESDSGSIYTEDLEEKSTNHGGDETLGLLCSDDGTMGSAM